MAGRSPARFIAPLALVGVAIALFMVVNSSLDKSGGSTTPGQTSGNEPSASPTAEGKRERKGPRRYRVKTGDTPSSIAEQEGVEVSALLDANPNADPNALSPGQKLKIP